MLQRRKSIDIEPTSALHQSSQSMQTSLKDPLERCITTFPTRWTGLAKLEAIPHEEALFALRQIPGTWYNKSKNSHEVGWYVPINIVRMGRRGCSLNEYPPIAPQITPVGNRMLDDYLARCSQFLFECDTEDQGRILGADPGAGKTIAALHALHCTKILQGRGLVVGPLSGTSTWCGSQTDPALYYGLSLQPIRGEDSPDVSILKRHQHFYINFDILHAWNNTLFAWQPDWIIFDESHKLLHASKRADAAYTLSQAACIQRRYLLTGTPIPRDWLAFYYQLRVAQPRQWGNFEREFGIRYCEGKFTPTQANKGPAEEFSGEEVKGHWEYTGTTNELELRARLSGVYLRVVQAQFERFLPKPKYVTIPLDISES